MTNDDLETARADSYLRETLMITHEFLVAMRADGVLEAFYLLQAPHQAHFLRVIGRTNDGELRAKRIATLVAAMKMSPPTAAGLTKKAYR